MDQDAVATDFVLKRNSLNNENTVMVVVDSQQVKLLKRHQSINKPVITNENIANMLKPSNLMNVKSVMSKIGDNKSNHQISLDSDIYLPSESEDSSFQLNVA